MNKLAPLVLLLSAFASATAATAPPKVVFIGDEVTLNWASAFAANPNWINKGTPGVGYWGSTSTAGGILAAFQSDVVSLHPAIVHILLGVGDSDEAEDATFQVYLPGFMTSLNAIVQEAKAANIKVVLGTLPSALTVSGQLVAINSIISSYAAANNIPLINYGDALCACVSSTEPPWTDSADSIGGDMFNQYGGGDYLIATPPDEQIPGQYWLLPSAAGYSMMTQMAESVINTMSLSLVTGWLSDVQQYNDNLVFTSGTASPTNVNTVLPGSVVRFTPVGYYSDGSQHPMVNTSFLGSSGTWSSSNPMVMYVNQQGVTWAVSQGTATIRYTAPNGLAFSPWVMHVGAGSAP